MKQLIISAIFVINYLIVYSQTNTLKNTHPVQEAIEALAGIPEMKNGIIGFYVIDLKDSSVVASINPDVSLAPASTQKVVTTATALELLGDTFRFETKIEYDGEIDTKNKILRGNIYIRGGGDPSLGSDYYPQKYFEPNFMDVWANEIKKAGIDSITGAVIGDAQIYSDNILPRMREWEAMANYYGAGACGLTIYDNLYYLTLKSPPEREKLTEIVKTDPVIPELSFDNQVMSADGGGDNAYIYGAPYTNTRTVRGTIPKNEPEFTIKGAIPDPAYLTAWQLAEKLKENAIGFAKEATTMRKLRITGDSINTNRQHIYTTLSPTLREIVYRTNIVSFNLYPEHLMTHIGLVTLDKGDTETGARAVTNFWQEKGMDTDGLFIHDGSGLFRGNMLTARQLVFILNYMRNQSRFSEAFYESLPVAGKSGTLKNTAKGTAAVERVHAKTGSIGKVRAFAGYVTTKSGDEWVFALLANNYNGSGGDMRRKMAKILAKMAEQ